MGFVWHEYRPHEEGYTTVLGPLETRIMHILWERTTATAREVYGLLREEDPAIRRSTVSIMLARLDERGLVGKTVCSGRGGLTYVYTVAVGRDAFEEEVACAVVSSLVRAYGTVATACMRRYLNSKEEEK
ncbi:MAG: BlaI/MecI/CopY family transcriptional regulator [Candidatus Methanofastidiosa archaeon]|nr:BlaI/MecI/CopY family transcriptional regulator [Candidatus Methanofastidiosa archaeon]